MLTIPLHPQTLPLLQSGRPVLVGLSGGRDSVALITSLLEIPSCRPVGCHINHGIRGEEAARDEKFSRSFCESRGIPFLSRSVNIPQQAESQGISIEEAARHARRKCFSEWAGEYENAIVALAHHADDQAETILFQLCRGVAGIKGIKPVSALEDGTPVIRPLLGCARSQISEYLKTRGISWVDDSTNAIPDCARNAIRLEILPELSRIMNREVAPIIARSANLNDEADEALDAAISRLDLIDPQGRLYLPKVEDMPASLKKAVIFRFLKHSGVPDLSERSISRVMDILATNAAPRAMLPGGWLASRKEKRLRLLPPSGEQSLSET